MSPSISEKKNLILSELKQSKLSLDEKLDLEHLVDKAAETSNGVETPAKIAGMSEVLFGIVTMMVSQRLDGFGKLNAICKVIVETKWQICIVVGTLAMALVFRPEVAELLKAVLK